MKFFPTIIVLTQFSCVCNSIIVAICWHSYFRSNCALCPKKEQLNGIGHCNIYFRKINKNFNLLHTPFSYISLKTAGRAKSINFHLFILNMKKNVKRFVSKLLIVNTKHIDDNVIMKNTLNLLQVHMCMRIIYWYDNIMRWNSNNTIKTFHSS